MARTALGAENWNEIDPHLWHTVGDGANLACSHCCRSTVIPGSSLAAPSPRESKKDPTEELFCLKGLAERLPGGTRPRGSRP